MKKQNLFQNPQVGDWVDVYKDGIFDGTIRCIDVNGKKQIQLALIGYFWHTNGRPVGKERGYRNMNYSIKPHHPQEMQPEFSQPQNTIFTQEQKEQTEPCPQCQGCGCPFCGGVWLDLFTSLKKFNYEHHKNQAINRGILQSSRI